MLVLTRKTGERIVVPELKITITVLECLPKRVRIGVEAPREKQVHRGEVWERIAEEDRPRAA
jgi:carbon storage regulator